jgi:hypothetical protein
MIIFRNKLYLNNLIELIIKMGLIIQIAYKIFLYLFTPAFILMLFGKPRFLITNVGKILNKKLFTNDLSILKIVVSFSIYIIGYSLYKINGINTLLNKYGLDNNYIQEKIREKHLYERNSYMFTTIMIMIIVINKLSDLYSIYWPLSDAFKNEIDKSGVKSK